LAFDELLRNGLRFAPQFLENESLSHSVFVFYNVARLEMPLAGQAANQNMYGGISMLLDLFRVLAFKLQHTLTSSSLLRDLEIYEETTCVRKLNE